jgi:hypothetical protein
MMSRYRSSIVLVLLALALGATATVASSAPENPPILLQIDHQKTVVLELGKNVHPQTYALLTTNPGFAQRADIEWVFVDDMWVPLKRTQDNSVRTDPGVELREGKTSESTSSLGPESTSKYLPECVITLSGVPAYDQCDYAAYLYNDSTYCGTMCGWGCAITSAAMVFSYFGASTDPGELNTCAGNHSCRVDCSDTPGYDPCCLVWGCAANSCSDNEAGFVNGYSFYWSKLCSMMSQSRPPIVNVGGHFVVVYKSLGHVEEAWSYYINDPADGSTYKKLSYYTDDPVSIIEYYDK